MRVLALAACATALTACSARSSAAGLPPLPRNWPAHTLQLGLANGLGKGATLAGFGHLGMRYQYLSGGVNTGAGWTSWGRGGGSIVGDYVAETVAHRAIPVFTYYQLLQSQFAGPSADEATEDLQRLRDPATMAAYFADLTTFFRRAAATRAPTIVLHFEPDLWGYVERAAQNDDASTVPAAVAASGVPELQGLPDNAAGFARAVVALRNRYARNVTLAYALSDWGTGKDIQLSHPNADEIAAMQTRSVAFYRSLHARFDLAFAEFANQDAGYAQAVGGDGGAAWWAPVDFQNFVSYLAAFSSGARLRLMLWQIPVGNTMLDNSPGHYRDNRVQWLLGGRRGGKHLRSFLHAGVIGLLFGAALPGDTGIGGDNGYLRARARAYYRAGPLRLPR
jgi:hypothetical protein